MPKKGKIPPQFLENAKKKGAPAKKAAKKGGQKSAKKR